MYSTVEYMTSNWLSGSRVPCREPLLVPFHFFQRCELRWKHARRERGRQRVPASAAAFVKVNDEHQKSQTREQNKQVVDHCSGVKSLGWNAKSSSVCARACVSGILQQLACCDFCGNNWEQKCPRNRLKPRYAYMQPHYLESHPALISGHPCSFSLLLRSSLFPPAGSSTPKSVFCSLRVY